MRNSVALFQFMFSYFLSSGDPVGQCNAAFVFSDLSTLVREWILSWDRRQADNLLEENTVNIAIVFGIVCWRDIEVFINMVSVVLYFHGRLAVHISVGFSEMCFSLCNNGYILKILLKICKNKLQNSYKKYDGERDIVIFLSVCWFTLNGVS